MLNEANTCRKYVLPKLKDWEESPKHSHLFTEQYPIDAGRILTTGGRTRRRRKKFADYLLCYTRDFPLAVVEAKRQHKSPQDGLEQAKTYAELLGLKFAYSFCWRKLRIMVLSAVRTTRQGVVVRVVMTVAPVDSGWFGRVATRSASGS